MPIVIGIFGVPCAGKTRVAQYLIDQHPLILLTTDRLRLKYGFASGLDTLATMYEIADYLLPKRVSLIFDGIHNREQDRAIVRLLAERHSVEHRIIFVTADLKVISRRLRERLEHPKETVADGKFVITAKHFERLASYLESPTETETNVVIVDTTEGKIKEQLRGFNEWLASCYL